MPRSPITKLGSKSKGSCYPILPCIKTLPDVATPLKKTIIASERDAVKREAYWQEVREVPASKLKFLDESGCHRSFTRLYGWAKRSFTMDNAAVHSKGLLQALVATTGIGGY